MGKFRSPFNIGSELWITQTYHTGGNNTAIDLSASTNTPVYALADGIVTYRSSGAGSYCIQTVKDSDIKIYYVHTYKWVNANTFVNKGDIICYIAPTSLNGGYPTHLHLGLQAGKEIMDYFDRSIIFRTKYQDIKNIWFKGEDLDWSKFRDLSYVSFKIGDKIQVTGEQNIRQGSGTSYPITGSTKIGEIYEIEDGPRTSDGYTWYDLKNNNWVADVGKFTIAPVEAPSTPICEEYIKQVLLLSEEIEGLKIELGTLGTELKLANERVSYVNNTLKTREAEIDELKTTSEMEIKRLQEDLDLKNKTLIETVTELNELKEGRDNWLNRLADILHKLFGSK